MRRIVKIFFIIIVLALVFPVTTFASKINHGNSDLNGIEENEFEQLIMKIENLKIIYPESSDEMILEMMDNYYLKSEIIDLDFSYRSRKETLYSLSTCRLESE